MQGRSAPLKPWERPGAQAGSNVGSPFAPSMNTNSTVAVISSSAANSEEKNLDARTIQSASIADGHQMPLRPWERPAAGYGSASYNRPYGSLGFSSHGGTYGSDNYRGGQYGSPYGNTYGGMYGGSSYGAGYGYGGYGGGLNSRYGAYGGIGGYGMGPAAPYGGYGPTDPNMPPPRPPNFWESMLHAMHGVLCDRTGVLYGELARFVLRLLGFRTRRRPLPLGAKKALTDAGTHLESESHGVPKGSDGAWDHVWSDSSSNEVKH